MNLDDYAEEMLTYLELAEPKQPYKDRNHNFDLSFFKDALSITSPTGTLKSDDSWGCFESMKPLDVGGVFDQTLLRNIFEDDDLKIKSDDYKFAITRFRSVSPKQIRGKTTKLFRFHGEASHCAMKADGNYSTARHIHGWNGRFWEIISSYSYENKKPLFYFHDRDYKALEILVSMQFSSTYDWRASIGYSDRHSVSFITDPIGAREIFKLRDVDPGKSRRSAIRSWISAHTRQSRKDPAIEIEIRKHLRGKTIFNWNGLTVKITPSPYDLKMNLEREC